MTSPSNELLSSTGLVPSGSVSSEDPSQAQTKPELDPLIGRVLGNYVIKRRLTEGGMGHVYIAEHEKLAHLAAVKVLKREMATDDEWSRRFFTEAQAGARLQSPNLVRVIDFGKMEDGNDYLLMEYLNGVPLDAYCAQLRKEERLDVAAVLTFAEQILNGLGAAHAEHVFHRDLKPANVMVVEEHSGKPLLKLIDFGLAKAAPAAMPEQQDSAARNNLSSLLAGTPEYVSPEQAKGQVVDGRADLYSLGVMLYEMLAGKLPFGGSMERLLKAHQSTRPPPLPAPPGGHPLPEGLGELVESLLEKSPENRPATAEIAKKAVQRILRKMRLDDTQMKMNPLLGSGATAAAAAGADAQGATPFKLSAPSTEVVLPQRMRVGPGLMAAIICGLVLLLVGAGWLLFRSPRSSAVAPEPSAASGGVDSAVKPSAQPSGSPSGGPSVNPSSSPSANPAEQGPVELKPGAEGDVKVGEQGPASAAPSDAAREEPSELSPLLPTSATPPAAAKSPKPGAGSNPKKRLAPTEDCPEAIGATWKDERNRDLEDLARFVGQERTMVASEWRKEELQLSREISRAQSSADCLKVNEHIEALRAKVMPQTEVP